MHSFLKPLQSTYLCLSKAHSPFLKTILGAQTSVWRSSGFVCGMPSASRLAIRSLVHYNCGPVREAVFVSRSRGYNINISNRFTKGFATAASMSDFKTVNVIVKGTVQGVFYRKWTVEAAQKLGLKGWVRNLEDGSVEAIFSGPSSAVDNMIQQCHSGPSAAKVSSVDISKWDNEVPQGFENR